MFVMCLVQNIFYHNNNVWLVCTSVKKAWKFLFTKSSPFSTWLLFCYHDNSTFNDQKQTLECIPSTCKVSQQPTKTMLLWMWLPCWFTNFSRFPQASSLATLRHCSPKGVRVVLDWSMHQETLEMKWQKNFHLDIQQLLNGGVPWCKALSTLAQHCALPSCLMGEVQFSASTDRSWRGQEGWFSRDSLPVLFCQRPLWAVLARDRDVHSLRLSIQPTMASSTLKGALKDGFGEAVMVWHAWTMQASVFWQLPKEVPVDSQGSWSCSTLSCWSWAASRRYREISSCTWFQKPEFFFQNRQARSMFHSRRGGWRWQETCRAVELAC